ncbi:MAG: DUF3363 domain-containing protein [Pseudomonadota bacterium]
MSSPKALSQHLRYISRDSAVRGEDQGRVFDGASNDVNRDQFAEVAKDDRHHFRLIVSPEDGVEMQDMKPFARDLVSAMEKDLQTRLEWVAAVHDNTDHPHVHIVVRGKRNDGRDLVMPRAYISHGIRERAEELVTLELGPETQFERDAKLARQTGAERLTQIDRTLDRLSDENGLLNLAKTPARYRSINAARLRTLKSLGLARHQAGQRWHLSAGFTRTLKELGERRDIIKQLHHALGNRTDRIVDPSRPFSGAAGQVHITGSILRLGLRGEGHDQPFIMIDGLDGRAISTAVANRDMLEGLKPGMIVTLAPSNPEPHPSDRTIAAIADKNGGIYSAALHRGVDPRSTPTFVVAHVRRLEALRRAGLVERQSDGSWRVPEDYLARVRKHQEQRWRLRGADVQVQSWTGIAEQVDASGLTWLDQAPSSEAKALGFGGDVRKAEERRRLRLVERGVLKTVEDQIDSTKVEQLRQTGLHDIANELSQELGKEYAPLPVRGKIQGVYRKAIVRPEGKFAVIERQKSFSLAPWRAVMERARGQAISVAINGGSISWAIGRQKGLSI